MLEFDFSSYGRIGVLYGGNSAEREISLLSGRAILDACQQLGIDAQGIDLNENNIVDMINQANIDTAFIALHGGIGEDGRLQALLDFMGIPYTGSDAQASILAMNKLISKQIWKKIGLATPQFAALDQSLLEDKQTAEHLLAQLSGQVMVKPANEGSSIGMAIATSAKELQQAYRTAQEFDQAVLAEELLSGSEYTVAILNGEALPPIKLETDHSFYDYRAKYVDDDTRYLCPCGLDAAAESALKALALQAFNSLQCRGWGRVDIMVDKHGEFSVLEINTVPGMTSHSLVPMAAKVAGYSFAELVGLIISGIE